VVAEPALEVVDAEVVGVEAGAGRVGVFDGEGREVVLAVPGAAHDVEVVELEGVALLEEALAQGGVTGPGLAVEDGVHLAGGGDQLLEGALLGLGEAADVDVELGWRELCDLEEERVRRGDRRRGHGCGLILLRRLAGGFGRRAAAREQAGGDQGGCDETGRARHGGASITDQAPDVAPRSSAA
jgi:hypothetical protein